LQNCKKAGLVMLPLGETKGCEEEEEDIILPFVKGLLEHKYLQKVFGLDGAHMKDILLETTLNKRVFLRKWHHEHWSYVMLIKIHSVLYCICRQRLCDDYFWSNLGPHKDARGVFNLTASTLTSKVMYSCLMP